MWLSKEGGYRITWRPHLFNGSTPNAKILPCLRVSSFWKIVIIVFEKSNDNKRRQSTVRRLRSGCACKLQAHLGNQPFLVAHLINAARKSEFVDNCGSSLCIMKNPNCSIARSQILKPPPPPPPPTSITSSNLLKNLILFIY